MDSTTRHRIAVESFEISEYETSIVSLRYNSDHMLTQEVIQVLKL